jgi:hypothetical protein
MIIFFISDQPTAFIHSCGKLYELLSFLRVFFILIQCIDEFLFTWLRPRCDTHSKLMTAAPDAAVLDISNGLFDDAISQDRQNILIDHGRLQGSIGDGISVPIIYRFTP